MYTIYKHTNTVNHKVYIGQTKQELTRRFRQGKGYKRCPYFYAAIQKYGWQTFETSVLATDLTLEQANQLEQYYIKLYDSTNRNKGYNIAKGGDGFSSLSSEFLSQKNQERWQQGVYNNIKNCVYCIELDEYIESALAAERKYHIDNSSIQKACRGKNKYAGVKNGQPLHWLFAEDVTPDKIQALKNKQEILKGVPIPIYCVELNQLFLGGASEASKIISNTDPSSIRKVALGKQKSHKGYHFINRPDLLNIGKFD